MRICHVIAAMAFALPLVLIAPAAAMADRDKCLDRNLDAAARIEACAVAIGEAPDADMFVARGRLFEEQEKFEQALDDFSNALDLTADHRKALERRMVVLNKTGDTIAAQSDAKRLIELEPDQRW